MCMESFKKVILLANGLHPNYGSKNCVTAYLWIYLTRFLDILDSDRQPESNKPEIYGIFK